MKEKKRGRKKYTIYILEREREKGVWKNKENISYREKRKKGKGIVFVWQTREAHRKKDKSFTRTRDKR